MKINYSCVVDNHDKFKKQGWIWLNSLIELGGINPAHIWVHCISGVNSEYIRKCEDIGVNVEIIEPFGDKKYCNKIPQMSNAKLKDADIVILMDTDMVMLENFERKVKGSDYIDCICGKIVDLSNPPIHVIDEVYKLAGLAKTLPDQFIECEPVYTYGANFNGGLYVIPRKYYDVIETGWQKWALWLLENENGKPMYDAGREANIDQVSFSMTVQENRLSIKYLDRSYNYPLPYDFGADEKPPYVLHYHDKVDDDFLLELDYEPRGNIKKAVDKANGLIKKLSMDL